MQSTPPATASIEDAFRPAFEEIQRRNAAAAGVAKSGETQFFAASVDALDLPFVLPGQTWALVSLGTAVLAPRPVDQLRPALRVYGAFETHEECVEHADVVRGLDPTCSLVAVRMREWMLMPQTEAARDDAAEGARRLQKRLQAHRVRQMEEGQEFDRLVAERLQGPTNAVERDEDEERATEEAESLVYTKPRRLRAGGEVRGQMAVALSVVPDAVCGECLFQVLGCFASYADADNWTRNVATRHVTDDDVFVAPTCEWLYPNGEAKPTATHYRVDELQRIMDAARQNPKKVREYKEWKAEQDRLADRQKAEAEGNADQNAADDGAVEEDLAECD